MHYYCFAANLGVMDMDNFELFDSESPDQVISDIKGKEDITPSGENMTDDSPMDNKRSDGPQKNIILYLHDLVHLLAIVIVVSLLLMRVVVVSGTSMTNTLMDGDYLLVLSNIFYKDPQAGDIIVASKDSFDNGAPIVKRVIAVEGQTVDIDFREGVVYVDGKALDEPYTKTATTLQEGVEFPLTVEKDCIFVLGDNRNGSRDSRSPDIGLINKQEVLGKVFFLFLPGVDEDDRSRDFGRIGVVD